ncbi:MAG: hypothetical protein ABH823_05515 [bacterium]
MFKRPALILSLCLFAAPVLATSLERGVSASIVQENKPAFKELYRLKIENKAGGVVAVSQDQGFSWEPLGKVIYPTNQVSTSGYSAAKWVDPGHVAATAVNAIHVKTGAAEWDRSIFSILPKEFLQKPDNYRSFLSPNSSIYTDIPAGKLIFGGGYAPFVGNEVKVVRPAQPVMTIPQDYVPGIGDILQIIVQQPIKYPQEITFENRFGGRISIKYYSGEEKVIGEVLRPVVGVGRFSGTQFIGPGRIRANHAGVIDVSTSQMGQVGGFQIVPALHGEDMGYVREQTQWMVIGPAEVKDYSLEGMAPFYKYFLRPSYGANDLYEADWQEKLLGRFLVQAKYVAEDKWRPMPINEINKFYLNKDLPQWANSALRGVTHFRILFPVEGN